MAANQQFADYATTALAQDITSGQTSFNVASSSLFPAISGSQYFYATLADLASVTSGLQPPAKREVVKVTAVSGTLWTIVRGVGGTASTFSNGDVVDLRVAKAALDDIQGNAGGFILAENFAGADVGAKINTALASIASGTVYVQTAGTISTAVTIGANKRVQFGPGAWSLSATITLIGSNATLTGAGTGTILTNTTAATPSVIVTSGAYVGVTVANMEFTRSATATAGGDGIQFGTTLGGANGILEYVISRNNYVGFALGPTSYSFVNNCSAFNNKSHGFYLLGTATTNGMQWYLDKNISQSNDGDGFRIASVAGSATMSVGEWASLRTYGNSGRGLYALAAGASYAIQALRIRDCFLGNDGSNEIELDTNGTNHTIDNCWMELGGTSATGSLGATGATNLSNGLLVQANDGNVTVRGCKAIVQSRCGFRFLNAGAVTITDSAAIDCGFANTGGASSQTGIYLGITGSYRAGVVNCVSKQASYTTQLYGVYCGTDGHAVIGCELNGVTLAVGGAPTSTILIGNTPLAGTGWQAPTGTLARTAFDQSTVTLAELAKRVAALVTDLQAQRIIGS